MQQTRLNTLVDVVAAKLGRLFSNPWRRISLILINLLLGIFVGSAVSTTAGQNADWDVLVAAILVFFTEVISWFFYGRIRRRNNEGTQERSLWLEVLNVFKIGLIYSLYLEAFKLGS
jgi:hypothetical protein